jgi:hypothetical protein
MRAKWSVIALIIIALSTAYAQMVSRPYRNGTVWNLTFVHIKPGMDNTYLTYLTTDWKREQEALKQQGMIVSYKVIAAEAHSPADWNLMLMTEYRDLATMEANEAKAEALAQQLLGGDEKIRQGYRERTEIREIVGERLAREVVLEPRPAAAR